MGRNQSSRLRSAAKRALERAQTEVEAVRRKFHDGVRKQVRNMTPAVGDWIEQAFPFIRKLVISLLLLAALAAVHFFGFASEMPESIQRLVASSFAPDFSATFIYYALLALLGARLATYIVAAIGVSWKGWKDSREALASAGNMRRYLRSAKEKFSILEWPIFVLAPILLALIYADLKQTLIAVAVITTVFVLLLPIAVPQAALAPKRFVKRLFRRHPSLKLLSKNINLVMVVAVALFAMSFYLGKARYERLSNEYPVKIRSSEYAGKAVILARADKATLVLERDPSGSHSRYVLFGDDFCVSATVPPDSELFDPPANADRPTPPQAVSSAASSAQSSAASSAASHAPPSGAAACQASGGR